MFRRLFWTLSIDLVSWIVLKSRFGNGFYFKVYDGQDMKKFRSAGPLGRATQSPGYGGSSVMGPNTVALYPAHQMME